MCIDRDHYGTTYREGLKNSMALPARPKGEWKTLNRRASYSLSDRVLVAFILLVLVVSSVWLACELLVRLGR